MSNDQAQGGNMKPQILKLFEKCIEDGVSLGLSRAKKHNDAPVEHEVAAEITKAIEYELHEWFNFTAAQSDDLLTRIGDANFAISNGDDYMRHIRRSDVEEMVLLLASILRLKDEAA